jgi:hypothetical protein
MKHSEQELRSNLVGWFNISDVHMLLDFLTTFSPKNSSFDETIKSLSKEQLEEANRWFQLQHEPKEIREIRKEIGI